MEIDNRTREELLAEITTLRLRLEETETALRAEQVRGADAVVGEAVYRAIGESIDYGVWVCAPDGRNIYASDSFLALVGITQQQCSDFGWGDVLHPDDAAKTIAAWKECARTGGRWDIEHRYRGVDGKYHDMLARGVPVRDSAGNILCWAGINLDISSLKHAQQALLASNQRLALLAKTARRLLESELPQEIVESLCHDVMAYLECDVFFNFLVDGNERIRLNACAGIPDEMRHEIEVLDYGMAICGYVAREGTKVIAENIQESDDPKADWVRSKGIRAYACHPLVVQGRVLGTLSFGARLRDSFSTDELELLEAVADLVAIAMERSRTSSEIEHLASFPQQNPNPVLEIDLAGRITFCNPAGQELANSIGAGDANVLVPPGLNELVASIDSEKEQQWVRELEVDNFAYQVRIYYSAQVKMIRLYLTDITALKLSQEKLQRTNEELEKRVASRTADLLETVERIERDSSERLKIKTELLKSNERYMLAVQGANDGIWDWDFASETAFVSPRWKSMLGYGDDEIRNVVEEWKALIHPDDFGRFMAFLDDYLAGRVSEFQTEYRLRHKDGSYRWVLTRGACFRDATGKPYRMAGSHTDITERKADEERLKRLNRLFVVLSESGLAIVRATDQQAIFQDICRIVVDLGKFLLAWVGLEDRETGEVAIVASYGETGYLDGIRISTRDEPRGHGPTGTVIREGKSYICNDYLNDPRTAHWHDWARTYGVKSAAATPLTRQGVVIGALTLYAAERDFFDVDMIELLEQMAANISFALDNLEMNIRRREVEAALQKETMERLRALEELHRHERIMIQQGRHAAMGEMIGNIAHQWRQPLNTLGLTIQQMKYYYEIGEFNEEFLNSSVSKAMSLVKHMSHTIEDFRNFFKPDKEKGAFSIKQAILQSVALIEASFKSQSISLEIDTADNLVVSGYVNEFSQALLNIMVNARDVLLEREVRDGRIRIGSWNENGNVVVVISDNGGGIPVEVMEKIFDPYFTTKGPDKGTGIGLYMAKTIIEHNMGGRLTASNSPDGAAFRIEVKHDGG